MKINGFMPIVFCSFLFIGCVSWFPESPIHEGINPAYAGYVPGKVSVLPCKVWPQGGNYTNQPQIKLDEKTLQDICSQFDQQVLNNFKDQPFISGFTPKVVQLLLHKNKQPEFLQAQPNYWHFTTPINCPECSHPLMAYNTKIKPQNDWLLWLNRLSELTLYSDAVLQPFILEATEEKFSASGLLHSQRRVVVASFLIDSNNAEIIWFKKNFAYKNNRSTTQEYPSLPSWEQTYQSLFSKNFWADFPGHINL